MRSHMRSIYLPLDKC